MAETAHADSSYRFEWVAAPKALTPYLNSLYILRTGETGVADMMPAYSGQLVVTLKGGGTMHFAKGGASRTTPAFLQCPLLQAQEFAIDPHTVMLGVSLNFRGWAALTGLPVDEYSDRSVPVADVFPEEIASPMLALVRQAESGELGEREALDRLAQIVASGISPLSERHLQVIDRTLEWLSSSLKPDIADLQDRLPYSERQVQRLVTRFFGQPPVRLIRRYRAIRAATMLAMPDLTPKLEAELREAFYDQAHMIKEIRHFTGRTPRRLQPKVDSVVKETLGEPGYGSVDLFGGNQDEELAKRGD
ncbi:helix-turn-helix domain-containing protein [Qipengyuania sp. 1NDH17]|uniref:Helix-turn-helix domain-containing protein n=1 Tax=Qipengyuania polymorpha TaxID=2867234 RepID=A0ABS7IZ53_9SPHN|nr:helix-turn-helix domain-containing protein [Qipengyuania polymorpha]MBX7458698.1 helix-turn-helix domain-containing protein [Qipengyuania polymorpha]